MCLSLGFTVLFANHAFAQTATASGVQIIEGEIAKTNKTTDEDGALYEKFPINAKVGQKVLVKMTGEGFKPAFEVGYIDGGKWCSKCATGHKIDENSVATIFYVKENMPLQIRASSMHAGDIGKFKVFYKVIDTKPLVAKPLVIGKQINDAISADDGLNPNEISYDATFWGNIDKYYIDLKAGQNIEIYAASNTDIPEVEFYHLGHDPYHLDWEFIGNAKGDGDAISARFMTLFDGRYYFNISNNPIKDISIADPTIEGKINYSLLINNTSARTPKIIPHIKTGYETNSTFDKNHDLIPSRRGNLIAKDYIFTPTAGKNYWITAQSKDTDVSIWIGKKSNLGEFELYQSDDDNAGGTGAKLLYQSKSNTPVDIRLFSNYGYSEYQKKNLAEYSFSIKEMTRAPTPFNGKSIKIGDKVLVQLKDGGYRNQLDALYEIYRINLKAGEKVTIFTDEYQYISADTYLEIGTGSPDNLNILAQDEDSGSGNNAKIRFTAPLDGEYYIRASATNIAHEDNFYLNIIPTIEPQTPPPPIEIAIGQEIKGELSNSSPLYGDDDVKFADYIFTATKDTKYKLSLKSDDFFANIMVRPFDMSDAKFTQSGDNTPISPPVVSGTKDNNLDYVSPISGKVLVRITSSTDNQLGKYNLIINEQGNDTQKQ